jgi:hypothetical protein
MSDAMFQISNDYELLALHKTVMEAKSHPAPENSDIPGSPLVTVRMPPSWHLAWQASRGGEGAL